MTIILEPDSKPDSKIGLIQHQKAIIQLSNAQSTVFKFCPKNNDEMYFILVQSCKPFKMVKRKKILIIMKIKQYANLVLGSISLK